MNRPEASLDRGSVLLARGYGRTWTLDTLRLALGPVLVTIVLGGCTGSDGLPTAPGGRPLLDESGAPALSGTLSPTANNQAVGPITLGSYIYPTLAVIQASGLLDRYYGPTSYWGDAAGTFIDQWDAAGGWTESDGCTGNVWVLSASGGTIFCDAGNHKNPTTVWADTQVVQGAVTAQWQPGPPAWGATGCGPNGQPPCYTYTGSHTVTVTPVPASLRLIASRYVTYFAAPSVTFTAAVNPTQVGGRDVPFSIQSWTWVADTGSASGPACGTANVCTFSPSSSGTMRVDAIVNGAAQNKLVHIRVLCKSTGDSLLDSLPILDAMDSAWKASNPTGPMANRRERPWTVQCTLQGECTWDVLIQASDGVCSSQTPEDPTGLRVAQGHTHPFIPNGFPGAEKIPAGLCPEEPSGGYLWPGPSQSDARLHAGKSMPDYILDGALIHDLPENASVHDNLVDPHKIPRKDNLGCTRV